MLVTYAGRLPGTDDFPAENVDYVQEQVERLIANLRPRLVVGSAAAGADLLVLEAAVRIGARAKVVLAGSRGEFRESSVAGRGSCWEQLFDALEHHAGVELIEVPRLDRDAASYEAVTQAIGDLADEAAGDDEPIVGLNVSAAREGPDHSARLAVTQELRDRLVLRVDPVRRRDEAPTAFVVMASGRRRDPARGWSRYEADATYRRVILPALIDSGYQPVRADAEALLEVVDPTVLRAIGAAKVLVADLATLNANVMWALGVRHAWRRAGTILLRPEGTNPSFEVPHVRVHEYARAEAEVSDTDAIAGIRLLRRLLEAVAEGRADSPAFLALPGLQEMQLPQGLLGRGG